MQHLDLCSHTGSEFVLSLRVKTSCTFHVPVALSVAATSWMDILLLPGNHWRAGATGKRGWWRVDEQQRLRSRQLTCKAQEQQQGGQCEGALADCCINGCTQTRQHTERCYRFISLQFTLKGKFVFFEVGSYKVHIYSRSVSYRNQWSAQPQFGEVESRGSTVEKM